MTATKKKTMGQLRKEAAAAPKFVIQGAFEGRTKVWAGRDANGRLGWTFDRADATEFSVGFDGALEVDGVHVGGAKVEFHKADGALYDVTDVRGIVAEG